jgi:putative addiction module component (TIGR02574 family)
MAPETLNALLKLSSRDRAALAMALWESLDDSQRERYREGINYAMEISLTAEQLAEIDRRLAEHLADPGSAIPWEKVRRKLTRKQ